MWSPNGKYIVSGDWDNTVQIWEALTGKKLLTYTGHRNLIYSVACSPDGKYIASGSQDKTMQVWAAI
jgi:WD40 repeat protein